LVCAINFIVQSPLATAGESNHPPAPCARRIVDAQGAEVKVAVFYDDVLGRRHSCVCFHCQAHKQNESDSMHKATMNAS